MSQSEPIHIACEHQCVKCGMVYACKKIRGSCGMPFYHGKCSLCN